MIPELPEIPEIRAASASALRYGLRIPPKPGMVVVEGMTDDRRMEAEKLANDMRIAFAFSRAQKEASAKRAKAKGRAAQRAAERR